MRRRLERGAASVEQVGLILLVALLMIAAISALAAGLSDDDARQLGTAIARKLRCAPRLPGPCWRDPLTEAYGRSLAGAVRALSPAPVAIRGPTGFPVAPVDFRYCRRVSCAAPSGRPGLTLSNRRMTAFTSVMDRRRAGGAAEISYWLYRPGLGWSRVPREATSAYVAAHASTPLLEADNPRLVPLETLPGRNHYDFPEVENPPWRWQIEGVYPG